MSAPTMSEPRRTDLRNIAIIAHVDHGKTTLVDAMLRQTGVFHEKANLTDRVMDTNDQERERGITIFAKQASVRFDGVKINIIDTPGHADFGGEVERTLSMADGAVLLVDAAEGPLPQTRFVLSEALGLGLPIVVVINKIDRSDARPQEVLDEVFDLFCELEASDAQADFKTLYAVARDGIAKRSLEGEGKDLRPLFETLIESVPAAKADVAGPFQMLVHDIQHDDYVGRLAVGRVVRGRVERGATVLRMGSDEQVNAKIARVYGFEALERVEVKEASAGEICCISGIEDVQIGDTLCDPEHAEVLERIEVAEPTVKVAIHVNTSPMAGLSGKWVTSRHIKERLEKEAKRNLAMRFEPTDEPDKFTLYGRGELMIAVLLETMRREGYEVAVGMPEVVIKEVDGVKCEPIERAVIDIPEEYVGAITTALGSRGGQMVKMANLGFSRARIEFRVPSRGLMGFRTLFLTLTRGTGLLNTLFAGWEPSQGAVMRRKVGAIVADRKGDATPYALFHLQPRGVLFIEAGAAVYEGMIIGEHNRENDLDVNVTREKKLTNIRAAGRDENVILSPPRRVTLEGALDWIDKDELLEVTPGGLRLRKKILDCSRRPRRDGPKKA
ncbi:MAG: translational GTPase TypA [Sandaracinaceae bacterium]